MVAAFEQSLSSMTTRLQQLSSSSEVKDCELDRLRKTIEILKQQSGSLVNGVKSSSRDQFGRRKGSFTSDYTDVESPSNTLPKSPPKSRYTKSANSLLIRRHTFNNALLNISQANNLSTSDLYGICHFYCSMFLWFFSSCFLFLHVRFICFLEFA